MPDFLTKLLLIAQYTLSSYYEQDAGELIQRCLDTSLPLVVWQPDLLKVDGTLKEILNKGLLSTQETVRQCVERFFRVCC
jgi:hypothetical protein